MQAKAAPHGTRLSSGADSWGRAELRILGGGAGVVLEKGEVILATAFTHASGRADGFAGLGCVAGALPPALRGSAGAPEGEVAERRLGGFLASSSPQAGQAPEEPLSITGKRESGELAQVWM